jgi:pimeloyl-ACP methyl ester carboxylesterase
MKTFNLWGMKDLHLLFLSKCCAAFRSIPLLVWRSIQVEVDMQVTSKDGTKIAYERQGSGPAVILVDGALCFSSFGPMPELSKLLANQFTVMTYDRRGRGSSEDKQPYAVRREVEDLEALIAAAGGSACLFGVSSGGSLVLETAISLGDKIKKIAVYEAPYDASEGARGAWKEYTRQLTDHLAAGRRGDAAALFMTFVGTPVEQVQGMRQAPVWQMFESVAPTLAYDAAVMGDDRLPPIARAGRITAPAVIMNGGAGAPFMADTARALAKAIPNARHRVIEGQRHDASMEVLAPVLAEFFKG